MSLKTINYEYHKKIKCIRQADIRRTFIIKCASDNKLYTVTEYDSTNMNANVKKDAQINANLLKQLEHPNILKTNAIYETKDSKLCFATDYIPGESLSDKIKGQKGQLFGEDQILDWFTQICLAIKYMDSKHRLLRDICTQNIHVTAANTIKLHDIILSYLLSFSQEYKLEYCAPEVIKQDPINYRAVIWSLGVILYELCTLSRPFKEGSVIKLIHFMKGKYKPIPDGYSKELKDLVASLLKVDVKERPGIHDVLENPLIKKRIEHFSTENIKAREDLHESVKKQKTYEKEISKTIYEKLKNVDSKDDTVRHALFMQSRKQRTRNLLRPLARRDEFIGN